MSNSEAQVVLTARWGMTELALVDPMFRVVAKAVGRLAATVAPGLYELRTIAGRQRHKTVVNLRPGESYVDDDVAIPFTPLAPVTDADRHLAESLASASLGVVSANPEASGLVVFLRGDPGQYVDPEQVALVGEDIGWRRFVSESWAGGVSSPITPGAHVLRCDVGADVVVDLPVWAQQGWQTVVFLPCFSGRPDPAGAVTHLRPLSKPWFPDADADIPLELLLQGLTARGPVPESVNSFENPMLKLAHAATLAVNEHPVDKMLLAELDRLLPGHPDVAALRFVGHVDPALPAAMPPTLASLLWRILLPADHDGQTTIVSGSPLEQVVPMAVPAGPWLAWRHLERSAEVAKRRLAAYLGDDGRSTEPWQIARDVGLTVNQVRTILPSVAHNRFGSLISLLSTQDLTMFVPGRLEALDNILEAKLDAGRALLSIDSPREIAETHEADYSLIVSGPDRVRRLVQWKAGTAEFPAERGEYRLSLCHTSRTGGRTSYEAVSFEPEMEPAFATGQRVVQQRAVIGDGRLELDSFEDSNRVIQLAVSSRDEVEPNTFALISVRFHLESDGMPEELAVPLTWLPRRGVSSGALRLGPLGTGLVVFVVPELVGFHSVARTVLRRSLNRIPNAAARNALNRAINLAAEREDEV